MKEEDMTKKEWFEWMYDWDDDAETFQDFDKRCTYKCDRCHGWYEEPCICYAR